MKLGVKLMILAGLSGGILLDISCKSTKPDQQEELNMEDPVSVSNFIFNGHGIVVSRLFAPRTLDQKVKEADLIILGKATAFGDDRVVNTNFSGGTQPLLSQENTNAALHGVALYERNLRIDINEVLWPPSASQTNEIIFPYYILKTWPESWWNYSNTPGVFFLVKSKQPERSEWTKLDRYNDWMEPETNTPLVRVSIKKQKR
jgi:hypothetical protein